LPFSTNENIDNAIWVYQETMDIKTARIDQIIDKLDDPCASPLKNAIDDFFQDLEEILIEDLLNDDEIIKLIQGGVDDNENNDFEEDFNESLPVSFVDAIKSL